METGVHLHPGQVVLLIAEEEHKPEQELVLIHLLNMVEVIVLDLLQRARIATHKIVLLMETGVHSHHGQAVQLLAEEEHKPEQEHVLIHLLNTAETIVLGLRQRAKVATHKIVQLMETGVHSHHGQAVHLNAEEEHKPEQELAQIHLLNTAETIVLGLRQRAKGATHKIVQLMETGVHSHPGQAVQLIAEEEHRPERELALIHLLNTAETIVLGLRQRARVATHKIAQLMEDGVHSHPGQAVQLIAEEEHKPEQEPVQTQLLNMEGRIVLGLRQRARIATHKIVLLMETGVHLHPGQAVQLIAEEEQKPEQEHVLIHLLNMVEVIVQGILQKAKVATHTIVQLMEVGLHSHPGQAVQLIAEEELKPEQGPALTQLPNTVEVIVQGILQKAKVATHTIVQLMEVGLHSHLGQVVQLIAEEEHRPEQGPALTQLPNTVEVIVQGILQKAKVATHIIVQLMEVGLHSHLGQVVQLIAEEEHRPEQEPVLTQVLSMEGGIVRGILLKARLATPMTVQVTIP